MKLCNIYPNAPHYRRAIFLKMDEAFDCAWMFGERPLGGKDIVSMRPDEFRCFLGFLKNVRIFGNWYWQRGVLPLLGADFDTYLILGEPYCVSSWLFCALAKLRPGKRVFFWSHGWYGRENFVKRILKKIFFRLADGVFLYGNYARELMIRNGFSAEKLWTIHNSLDYAEQRRLRERLVPSDILKKHFGDAGAGAVGTLIFVGRLTAVKRLDMIAEAMVRLARERGKKFNLVLVGDGAERCALEEKFRALGLEGNVWFYGACYDDAVLSELIFNADLCVAPGNIGLTAMHALAFGCPCLTHNDFKNQMPEFEAIVPGKTGAFFERGNVTALADAIEAWFASARDRDAVRRACYAEIEASWTADWQLGVFRRVLSGA